MSTASHRTVAPPCRLLTLDGGGAKGFYTLGVLKEVEALIAQPLCERFDLVFGTSTGAIIAALIALGRGIDEIHALYKAHVPRIMGASSRTAKSRALQSLAETVFGNASFGEARTGLGIVATHWSLERPMIFKSSLTQAHARRATFVPGFGCTLSEAIQASCSAYPFFDMKVVTTSDGSRIQLLDGGYCANNPTLYAIADATKSLGHATQDLRVISVGVGAYPERRKTGWAWLKSQFTDRLPSVLLLQKTLDVNTMSMDQLRSILFKEIPTVRIHDTFDQPELATDFLEHDLGKLDLLYQRGRNSFAAHEDALRACLL
jgi:uncharacterized protein